jgi:hypothetical protein
MMPAARHHHEPETEGEMNGYATHELARIRQRELIADAEHFRLLKEARVATSGTAVPFRPLTWLRGAGRGFTARLVTLRGAQAGGRYELDTT